MAKLINRTLFTKRGSFCPAAIRNLLLAIINIAVYLDAIVVDEFHILYIGIIIGLNDVEFATAEHVLELFEQTFESSKP